MLQENFTQRENMQVPNSLLGELLPNIQIPNNLKGRWKIEGNKRGKKKKQSTLVNLRTQ